jgi:hypothetical protein
MNGHVTTRPLYTRETTPISTEKKAASASVSLDILEKRNSLFSTGIRIPNRPACGIVSLLTTLSRLPELMAGL